MALTKIGSIGINTGIQFAGVTTISTLNGSDSVLSVGGTVNFVSDVSIGGTVSIAGTLTYEDVTNIDAVGLITARNGVIVGSGITLSKDGDIFATGVTTTGSLVSSGAISGTTGTFSSNLAVSGASNTLGNTTINGGGGAGGVALAVDYSGDIFTIINTGDVRISDSITHLGDTNTAIRFPSADTFSVETAGTERLRITSAGHLLHGVTTSEDTTGNSGTKLITTGDLQIDGDQKAIVFRSTASTAQKLSGLQWWNESGAGVQCAIFGIREAVSQAPSALGFYTSDNVDTSSNNGEGNITERLRITARGDIAFNRVGMSTAVGDSTDTNLNTADPNRFIFNNDHSNAYTDASLKLYLYNLNATRQGFTSGPEYDLQYHTSGSSPSNTNLSVSKHTFFKENKKIFQLGYKSSTGENVIGHVGLTTGTSKLAWGNPTGNDYRLTISGGAALVFGVDGDSEFFAIDGHWTGQRHVEYMRISKEGYMTKPYQPSFLVHAGRAGDGYTDSPYQFRTAIRNIDSKFKMTSGTGQYSYYYVPVTGLYLFTTHAAYQQSGVNFNTRIHRYNSAGAVQEVLELHRNVGFSGSHAGGAGSCMMYCQKDDYVYVAPDHTPYHLNTSFNFFGGCLLG